MNGARLRQGSQEKYLPSEEGRVNFVIRCRRRVPRLRQSVQRVKTAYEKLRQVARGLCEEGWARSLGGVETEILRVWLWL
jgi:hypothetical protein